MPDTPTLPGLPKVATPRAFKAIIQGSGPLYQAIIKAVSTLNPSVPQDTVTLAVRQFLGPMSLADFFGEMTPDVSHVMLPDVVFHDSEQVAIRDVDHHVLFRMLMHTNATTVALQTKFGGLVGYLCLRERFVAEGGRAEHMDRYTVQRLRKEYEEVLAGARREAGREAADGEGRSGCATPLVLLFGAVIIVLSSLLS